MSGVHDDLATLRAFAGASPRRHAAVDRVEAEIARLEHDNAVLRELPSRETVRRAEAAEAEAARLRDGLRQIASLTPFTTGETGVVKAPAIARALLTDDGAAHPWEKTLTEWIAQVPPNPEDEGAA